MYVKYAWKYACLNKRENKKKTKIKNPENTELN